MVVDTGFPEDLPASGAVVPADRDSADGSPRLAADAALRHSEQRFRDIVESMGDWYWEMDADGRLTTSSEHCLRLLGRTRAELLGHSTLEFAAPDDVARQRRYLDGHGTPPQPLRDFTGWYLRPDGTRVCIAVSGVPFWDQDGEFAGWRGVARDVTERVREEEERRRLEAEIERSRRVESLGVLAGGIAHDFNNLLATILGNAELALAELPKGGPRHLVSQIQAAGQHAAELTRQMLAYAGRGRLQTRRVDLTAAVREMAQLLGAAIPKKVALTLDLAEGLPAVLADPGQLRQVVMNLVINAADAIGHREGRIQVRTTAGVPEDRFRADLTLGRIESGRDLVCFDVSDSGDGIAPETLAKIFDPFFTTKFTGRGLGLAAVQGIVLRHGGTIAVSTAAGAGATFRVCFPTLADDPPAAAVPRPAAAGNAAAPAAPWRGSGTILLAEDEEAVRAMTTRMLRTLGFEVLAAADGFEAVAAAKAAGAAGLRAVLLDLTMPRMDGRETLRELHCLNRDLPVILCSGYDVLENTDRFAGLDFSGFLQKPYRLEDLARALRQALGE